MRARSKKTEVRLGTVYDAQVALVMAGNLIADLRRYVPRDESTAEATRILKIVDRQGEKLDDVMNAVFEKSLSTYGELLDTHPRQLRD